MDIHEAVEVDEGRQGNIHGHWAENRAVVDLVVALDQMDGQEDAQVAHLDVQVVQYLVVVEDHRVVHGDHVHIRVANRDASQLDEPFVLDRNLGVREVVVQISGHQMIQEPLVAVDW